ncbi:conserved Plasmodium protein, unknown function [Babesia microti strain RI]|uniref:WIBG Mago-binding domain-containing protein n=1 Tax=Babesia microti (strain RI) TaxID=1133968 RepID=I7IQ46_BABMR|nr:conserved Plasmodium protein, unknown function [Babesia microti strain RI]CCF73490.1 conserved Plasmodium protein, unknown function [Babesia microti strain RI]|eukprot:XP_012648099.1 conserved Plasmodium protein, unknown function [Babesia microti strain RI]
MLESVEVENAIRQETAMGEVYYINKITGEKVIKGSRRPDGSIRKDIKVRPGYIPKDEQSVFVPRVRHKTNEISAKSTSVPGWDDSMAPNGSNNKFKTNNNARIKNKKRNNKQDKCFEIIEGVEAIKISQQEEKEAGKTMSKDNKIRNLAKS